MFFCVKAWADGTTHSYPKYSSPVNYPITLAGNFGEPRPNHFHGGVDIKTDGVEGKPVFSIGDGYVSQVSIGVYGFGNAVYVHHPEGYTSVYCHLKKFSPQIAAMVRRWQYQHHSPEGVMKFRPTDLPVSHGQLIAVSGNTGSSYAPHLHLEIHDNRTWNLLDPLEFIGDLLVDGVPPQAHAFMACPKEGEGIFEGSSKKQTFGFSSHHLEQSFQAWGKVGFALRANDYMDSVYNHYGVRRTELFVDDHLVFSSDVDNFPVTHHLQVNHWGDYSHYLQNNVWYLKSFILPGLTFPALKADENRGYVVFSEERDYHLKYVLTDIKGNRSEYSFVVSAKPMKIPQASQWHPMRQLLWNRMNSYQLPGLQLLVRKGLLAEDEELSPRVDYQSSALSDAYTLMPRSFQLLANAPLSLQLKRKVKDPSKLYIVSHFGIDRYMGGDYADGWVTGQVRELGATYEIEYDDMPPKIEPVQQENWNTTHSIRFDLWDAKSGLASYEGTIDGHYVLFERVGKTSVVACRLADSPIKKTGKSHQLVFTATDQRNNKQTYTTSIYY
ncbi:MAG: M23 family metallopeptidase [Bacteroidaceae bacterium]|nr:M23 family metallopeptidase [Bacteroidaceae bacterium]